MASPCVNARMQVLLNKKYTLPHRVVDAVVDYFLRFGSSSSSSSSLPVLWHQGLLVFAQVGYCVTSQRRRGRGR